MVAAEIGQRRAVDHGAGRRAQLALEDRRGVGAGDRVHGVEAHAEAAARTARGCASKSNSVSISAG